MSCRFIHLLFNLSTKGLFTYDLVEKLLLYSLPYFENLSLLFFNKIKKKM